eukprot:11188279-Lingulodinium_polyedra.AAC.1
MNNATAVSADARCAALAPLSAQSPNICRKPSADRPAADSEPRLGLVLLNNNYSRIQNRQTPTRIQTTPNLQPL